MSINNPAGQAGRDAATSGLTHGRRILKSIFAAREAGLAAALLALVIFLTVASPYFMTASNLVVVSRFGIVGLAAATAASASLNCCLLYTSPSPRD